MHNCAESRSQYAAAFKIFTRHTCRKRVPSRRCWGHPLEAVLPSEAIRAASVVRTRDDRDDSHTEANGRGRREHVGGHHWSVEQAAQGWHPDPFGRHEERWMSAGEPTDLVRDGVRESREPADSSAPLPEIDVDELPTDRPLPFPWRQSRWPRALVLAALACAAVAILASTFGHAIARTNPLGPNEAIGKVVYATGGGNSTFVMASYTPQDRPDSSAYPTGLAAHVVSDGQTVVVRYDSNKPTDGTVLSQPAPGSSPNGLYGVLVGVLGFLGLGTLWVVGGFRKWRVYRAREAVTDYRVGPWAGTTNSA